jgi:hypothetical protein
MPALLMPVTRSTAGSPMASVILPHVRRQPDRSGLGDHVRQDDVGLDPSCKANRCAPLRSPPHSSSSPDLLLGRGVSPVLFPAVCTPDMEAYRAITVLDDRCTRPSDRCAVTHLDGGLVS